MTKIIQLNDKDSSVLNLDGFHFADRHEEDTYEEKTEVTGGFFRKTVTTIKKTGKKYELRVCTSNTGTLTHWYECKSTRDEDAERVFSMVNDKDGHA